MRTFLVLALLAGLATAAYADAQLSKVDGGKDEAAKKTNFGPDGYQAWAKKDEAGQKTNGGASGPDSWQFWQASKNEAGQKVNGGASGPDSWQFWQASKNEAGQKVNGGASGPDSWQFWGPNRQLLNKEAAKPLPAQTAMTPVKKPEAAPKQTAMAPAKKQEAAPKQTAMAPKQTAMAPAKKPEAAAKQQQAPVAQQGAAAQQQAPQNVQPERGFRGWGWGANADLAGMPGGGQAYPLMYGRNIYSAAGWGGAPVTCAQGELAHACSTRKKLLLHRKMLH